MNHTVKWKTRGENLVQQRRLHIINHIYTCIRCTFVSNFKSKYREVTYMQIRSYSFMTLLQMWQNPYLAYSFFFYHSNNF